MKQNNKHTIWPDVLGFIVSLLMLIYIYYNYNKFISHDYQGSTGTRFITGLIKKIDTFGGPGYVYGFFITLMLFFLYSAIKNYIKQKKQRNN